MIVAQQPTTLKDKVTEAFHKEIETYWEYSEIEKLMPSDKVFQQAVWEMMDDEYLHARFLRRYMIDKNMYNVEDPWEKKYKDLVADKMTREYGWKD